MKKVAGRVTPSTVVAVVALLFAMTGGAFAAGHFVITSTKQISPKVLKALHGAPGRTGATGPQGPAGAAGSAGKEGAPGKEGVGKEGAPGKEGKEGKEGREGAEGKSGFTAALPSGDTETGTWSVSAFKPPSLKLIFAPISFSIPVATGGEAVFVDEEETEEETGGGGCNGSLAHPTAPKGKLCIYTASEEDEKLQFAPEAITEEEPKHFGSPGTYLMFPVETGGQAAARGVWAVTAP